LRQLEAQRQRIADYCRLKGLHLAEVYEDPGISAQGLTGRDFRAQHHFLSRASMPGNISLPNLHQPPANHQNHSASYDQRPIHSPRPLRKGPNRCASHLFYGYLAQVLGAIDEGLRIGQKSC
jgi:hypothetical protein